MMKMAEKNSKKIVLDRVYNVPLRRHWVIVQKYKRAKKASTALRNFLIKHMKSENIKIDVGLNMYLWKHGMQNPPHHVKINAKKFDDGEVLVYYAGDDVKTNVKIKKLTNIYDAGSKKVKVEKSKPKSQKSKKFNDKKKELKVSKKDTSKDTSLDNVDKNEKSEVKKNLLKSSSKKSDEQLE